MKKLMFGLAIAAVGSAFAVESSNIVGYNQTALRTGGKIVGMSFVDIGAAGNQVDLTKVTVGGYDSEEGSADDVNVQILDQYGRTVSTYYWEDYTKKKVTYYGWMDGATEEMISESDVVISAGDGVWMDAPSAEYYLQCNGQVFAAAATVTLRTGGKLVANPRPTSIDLNDLWISGYDSEEGSADDVNVQILDQYGRTISTYYWEDYTKKKVTYYGWMDGATEEMIEDGDVTIGAGEAVWVDAPSTSYIFNFPALSL